MAYRVVSGNWAGGNGLAASTPVVLVTPTLLANFPGWISAAIDGVPSAQFYYHDAINGASLPAYQWLGARLPVTLSTLASAPIGSQVLIQTSRVNSGGWELGTVIDDGVDMLIAGAPVPRTARAAFPLVGAPSAGTFALSGIGVDGVHFWFAASPLTPAAPWKSVAITIALPSTSLSASMSNVDVIAPVLSTVGFPASGTLKIDSEQMTYAGTTGVSFTGLVRGTGGTTAAAHANAAPAPLLPTPAGLGTMVFTWSVGSAQGNSGSTTANVGGNFNFVVPGTGMTLQFAPANYVPGSTYTIDTTATIVQSPSAASGLSIYSASFGGLPSFYASALTTLGALSPGNVALVETAAGVWSSVTI